MKRGLWLLQWLVLSACFREAGFLEEREGGARGRMLGSVLPNGDSVDWVRVGVMSTGLVAA